LFQLTIIQIYPFVSFKCSCLIFWRWIRWFLSLNRFLDFASTDKKKLLWWLLLKMFCLQVRLKLLTNKLAKNQSLILDRLEEGKVCWYFEFFNDHVKIIRIQLLHDLFWQLLAKVFNVTLLQTRFKDGLQSYWIYILVLNTFLLQPQSKLLTYFLT